MNRFKDFIEWKVFGVCARIGEVLGDFHAYHQEIFHLHILPHYGVACDNLYFPGFLDECEALYPECPS